MEPQGKLNDVDWPAGREKVPPAGRFSLSVGKYVVKGVRRKKECLDLCCKYTCLRHIWQYAGGIIHRDLGCAQLRWQRQRRIPYTAATTHTTNKITTVTLTNFPLCPSSQ